MVRNSEEPKTLIDKIVYSVPEKEEALEALKLFKKDLEELKMNIAEYLQFGINLKKEEEELNSASSELNAAEDSYKKNLLQDGKSYLLSYKNKYDSIKPKLEQKLNTSSTILHNLNNLQNSRIVLIKLFDESLEFGIEVSTEKDLFISAFDSKLKNIEELITTDKLQKALEKINELKQDIIFTNSKITIKINEQKAIFDSYIYSLLQKTNRINEIDLQVIPPKLRKWAMRKYLTEHLTEGITLEGNSLVKLKMKDFSEKQLSRILDDLTKSFETALAAILRKDGLVIASTSKREFDPNVVGAIGAKMANSAQMVSLELGKGKVNRIIINTTDSKLIEVFPSPNLILISLLKQDIDTGLILLAMEEISKKLSDIL